MNTKKTDYAKEAYCLKKTFIPFIFEFCVIYMYRYNKVGHKPTHRPPLPPGNFPGTHFC